MTVEQMLELLDENIHSGRLGNLSAIVLCSDHSGHVDHCGRDTNWQDVNVFDFDDLTELEDWLKKEQ